MKMKDNRIWTVKLISYNEHVHEFHKLFFLYQAVWELKLVEL